MKRTRFPASDAACAALLVVQLAGVVHARLVPHRYFCWAPFDVLTRYELTVSLPGGKVLAGPAAGDRYHFHDYGVDNRSPWNVIKAVRDYEETYGKTDHAEVVVRYAVNGAHRGEWRWPPR
jgi:hypothetical protein